MKWLLGFREEEVREKNKQPNEGLYIAYEVKLFSFSL